MSSSEFVARRRPDIQGLRAIAVLSVVAFHASAGVWPAGGFVGVDVFFVISGFLITQILLKDIENERFSLVRFYQRRIRRLYPVLLTVLLAVLVAGAILLSPRDYRELAITAAATTLFVSNIAFNHLLGYFEGGMMYKPLVHTWSLAVEEQFYILFPIFLFLTSRVARGAIGPLLFGLALLSMGVSVWASDLHQQSAFYLAPVRAFELLIGAIVAYYPDLLRPRAEKYCDVLSVLGLGLIIGSIVMIDGDMAFPGAIAFVPCFGTALVIAAGQRRPSVGGRLISSAPFVVFGDISYSLYLWHWPFLVFARHWALAPLSPVAELGVSALSIVVAYLSWRWIEVPFIRGLPRLPAITAGLAASGGVCAICIVLIAMNGLPDRFSARSRALFAASEDYNHRRDACHSGEGAPIPYDRNCTFGAANATPATAVWADSNGAELAAALGERVAAARGGVMEITASACPPVLDYSSHLRPYCKRHNLDTVRHLAADPRIKAVLMLADFDEYPETGTARFEQGLEAAVGSLTRAGKRVTIFDPLPILDFDAPIALGMIALHGQDPAAWGLPEARYRAQSASAIAMIDRVAKATGARVVVTADLVCREDFCPAYARGEGALYFNADHLSMAGARHLAMALPSGVFED